MAELTIGFDYNAGQLSGCCSGPGLIDWVTGGDHLGLYRNYVEMDIDDTFTPDDSWDTTNHTIDYSDADACACGRPTSPTRAQWSQTNDFRMDQLFNFGSSGRRPVAATWSTTATTPPTTCGPAAGRVPGHRSDDRQALHRRLRLDQPHLRHPLPRRGLRHPGLHRGRAEREHQLDRGRPGGHRRHRRARADRDDQHRRSRWGPRTRRSSCRATTRASPTWCRATRPPSTRRTSTRRPPARPAGRWPPGTYEYAVTDQFNAS